MSNGAKVDAKIVLLGQQGCGKTCLVERYLYNRFGDTDMTVGAAFGAKRETVSGKSVTLGVWDTAGSERFESMTKIYYRGAWAAILAYDITAGSASLQKAEYWANELREQEPSCRIYICGCKLDLESSRTVQEVEVMALVDKLKSWHFEISSKDGTNVQHLFATIAKDFVRSGGASSGAGAGAGSPGSEGVQHGRVRLDRDRSAGGVGGGVGRRHSQSQGGCC